MTDVNVQERTSIEEEVAGRTLCTVLERTVQAHGNDPAYSDRATGGQWRTLTWRQVREQALDLAAGLVADGPTGPGLQPGEVVAIMASNRIEHVLADLAAVHSGGTPMTLYATLAPEQVAFIAGDSRPAVVVLESTDQVRRWEKALAGCDSIRSVVVVDPQALSHPALAGDPRVTSWGDLLANGAQVREQEPQVVENRWRAVVPEQPLTMLYTSGTTGNPKGVVLTHRNVLFNVTSSARRSHTHDRQGVTVSYLPFAHIAERSLGMYHPQSSGGHVHLVADIAQLGAALVEVRPTAFFGVPRVWEKIRTGITARLAAEPDESRRAAIQQAMQVGLEYVESQQLGRQTSPELLARFGAYDQAVLSPLRAALGLDRVEWAGSAAAPMPLDVARFFAGLGLRIYDVYGMTETSGSITANGPECFRLGTVGRAQEDVEVRIAEDGEICVRGPLVTPGYLGLAAETAALVDDDGWLHTGDIGTVDEDGFVTVVDRKKELIITSSGKNIAPSLIENHLKESPLVGHALAYGDGRPYVVAVLTLDPDVTPVWARSQGVEATGLDELAADPRVRAAVGAAVQAANARLSQPEQVKRWELLGTEWSAESEELTPTLKLRRRVVHRKYTEVIDRLYAEG